MYKICGFEDAARRRPLRRRVMISLGVVAAGLALGGSALAKGLKVPPKPQNVVSPDGALKPLVEGNDRYVEDVSKRHDFKHERAALLS